MVLHDCFDYIVDVVFNNPHTRYILKLHILRLDRILPLRNNLGTFRYWKIEYISLGV